MLCSLFHIYFEVTLWCKKLYLKILSFWWFRQWLYIFPHTKFLYILVTMKCVCLVSQLCPILWPYGLQPTRLLCPWASPGKNTGVGCHAFPSRGPSRPRDWSCISYVSCIGRQVLHHQRHLNSPLVWADPSVTSHNSYFSFVVGWSYHFCLFSKTTADLRLEGRPRG